MPYTTPNELRLVRQSLERFARLLMDALDQLIVMSKQIQGADASGSDTVGLDKLLEPELMALQRLQSEGQLLVTSITRLLAQIDQLTSIAEQLDSIANLA